MADQKPPRRRRRPKTPEEYENRLIMASYERAEQQIEEGQASSMVLVHFLKLGTSRSAMEAEKLKNENLLLEAKTKQFDLAGEQMKMLEEAKIAFTRYQGGDPDNDSHLL
jgi:hypothetical protein